MLKIRLMGTKNDIKWFEKLLQRQPKVLASKLNLSITAGLQQIKIFILKNITM